MVSLMEHGAGHGVFAGRSRSAALRVADCAARPAYSLLDALVDRVAPCPWHATAGSRAPLDPPAGDAAAPALYTAEERRRRDQTPWTAVQGFLAPVQFVIFLVSLGLVLHYLATGEDYDLAAASVVVKTLVLYAIMITGSIWEKKVSDRYLFAPAFYWEDVFSMLVLALHTLYLAALWTGDLSGPSLMLLALAAYGTYVINAGQFILKLRAARLQEAARQRSILSGAV